MMKPIRVRAIKILSMLKTNRIMKKYLQMITLRMIQTSVTMQMIKMEIVEMLISNHFKDT
jgi:hypothetical protein